MLLSFSLDDPSPLLLCRGSDVFRAVRFKIIADDGTVVLMPIETRPVDDKAHSL